MKTRHGSDTDIDFGTDTRIEFNCKIHLEIYH